jgi:hypothetical protein
MSLIPEPPAQAGEPMTPVSPGGEDQLPERPRPAPPGQEELLGTPVAGVGAGPGGGSAVGVARVNQTPGRGSSPTPSVTDWTRFRYGWAAAMDSA